MKSSGKAAKSKAGIVPAQGSQTAKQLTLPIDKIECPHYDDCAAPLCPRDISFGRRVWFPGEPICRLKVVPDWVRKQRKIARLPDIDTNRYFTLRMLNSLPQIKRGLQGANPDYVTAERIWFAAQPGGKSTRKTRVKTPPDSEQSGQADAGTYPLW